MNYDKLTKDQQIQMIEQRLVQYEQEHFNHSVNVKLLEESGSTDSATMKAIVDGKSAMELLDKAHANAKVYKDKIK